MVFDYLRAHEATTRIIREGSGGNRKHPVYRFYDTEGDYICEVRYGDAAANALQRGLWTHTRKGLKFFDSITNGWIDYSHNHFLVELFSHALVSSAAGHTNALEQIKKDIDRYETTSGACAMNNLPLFDGIVVDAPRTEGIKYAGSKLKLLPHILELAQRTGAKTVLDGFAGSTRVSQAFAQSGYRVISNDIAVWSEVFGTCYLLNREPRDNHLSLIRHLNRVPPMDGWFTQHYGGKSNGGVAIQHNGLKKPWQIHNTRKLDGIREEIDNLSLSTTEKAVALTSLILGLDRVDNTLGHFVSYLRNWSPRSYNELHLEVPNLFVNAEENQVIRGDIFNVASRDADLAYFDPPYGSNNEKMPPSRVRYASYYHLWTTVCLNDRPTLFGKAMRRSDTSDVIAGSVFAIGRTEFRQPCP